MEKIVVLLAEGFEECEGLLFIDLFRRAGLEVVSASITEHKKVRTSHQIKVKADKRLSELDSADFTVCVLPGGRRGAENLKNSEEARAFVRSFADKQKLIVAVCAAPTVLEHYGVLEGHVATCFPGMKELLGDKYREGPTVDDALIVTGNALGGTIPTALTVIEKLCGKDAAEEVCRSIVYPYWGNTVS